MNLRLVAAVALTLPLAAGIVLGASGSGVPEAWGWVWPSMTAPARASAPVGSRLQPAPESRVVAHQSTDQSTDPTASAVQVLLPVLHSTRAGNECSALVSLQNLGADPTKALIVGWEEPADSPGSCAQSPGPLQVGCTGLIRPGSSWLLGPNELGAEVRSAVVFSLGTRTLSDIGATAPEDDVVADWLCRLLGDARDGAPGDGLGSCQEYVAFQQAFESGTSFEGVPMHLAVGSPLAASVLRSCPVDLPGARGLASYEGIGANALGTTSSPGEYQYLAGPVSIDTAGGVLGTIFVQNAGRETAAVQLYARAEGGAESACGARLVPPGSSYALAPESCVTSPWRGRVRLVSTQRLAAVVDVLDETTLIDFTAAPETVGRDAAGAPWPGDVQTAAFGSLAVDPDHGWRTEVTVQNHSATRTADVAVALLDAAGESLWSTDLQIASLAQETVTVHASGSWPSIRYASLRVVSNTGAEPAAGPAPISAVAVCTWFEDPTQTNVLARLAYNLQPSAATRSRGGAPGPAPGAAVVAVPLAAKDPDYLGINTDLVLANQVAEEGWTDVSVLLFDQNGLADVLCRRLGSLETQALDLYTIGAVGSGFVGSAIVSASYWNHADPWATGETADPLVGIDAVGVTLQGGLGDDVPGDQIAAVPGVASTVLPYALARRIGDPCGPLPEDRPLPTALPAPDGPALDGSLYLPVIAYMGYDDTCAARLEIENSGPDPAKAVVVLWQESGWCPPEESPPIDVRCSGLIAPGGQWSLTGADLGTGVFSAAVYAFNTRTLGDLGVEPGSSVLAVDRLCEGADDWTMGSAHPWHLLRTAYDQGSTYAGLDLAQLRGGPLEATLERTCPDLFTPTATNTSLYGATPGREAHATDPADGSHVCSSLVRTSFDGSGAYAAYVQNVGRECAVVGMTFRHGGDCLYETRYPVGSVAPGEAVAVDLASLLPMGSWGTVAFDAGEPIAVVIDDLGAGRQSSHRALPGRTPADVNADGTLDAGDATALEAALGTSAGQAAWLPRADLDHSGLVDTTDQAMLAELLCGRDRAELPEPSPAPARRADRVLLPVLQRAQAGTTCSSLVAVQNVGTRSAKAVLLTWGPGGGTAPTCDAPSDVVCSGLLGPGGTWLFDPGSLPGPVASGMVYSLATATMGELGVTPGSTELAADRVCDALEAGAIGSCTGYAAFALAFDQGSTYADVPLEGARGPGLAAQVDRSCGAPATVSSDYEGIGANALGAQDPARGYAYHVPLAYGDRAGFDTALHLQNAGSASASVTAWAASQGTCGKETRIGDGVLDPGESLVLDVGEGNPDFMGSVRVVGTGPVGVVADIVGRDTMSTFVGVPPRVDYDANGQALPSAAATDLYGPISFDFDDGQDVGVQVTNLSDRVVARVHVEFRDDAGRVVSGLDDEVCPLGSQTFFLPTVMTEGDGRPGWVRVESLRRLEASTTPPAPITAVAVMQRYSDPQRTETLSGLAYNLLRASQAVGWTARETGRDGGLADGIGVVALPGAQRDPNGAQAVSHIAVANVVLANGWTEAAVLLFDQNGLVETLCRRIEAGHVEFIDLAASPLPVGFAGGAVVSAAVWNHPVMDRVAGRTLSLVGLAAALVTHRGPGTADPVGDEVSVSVGEPLRQLPWPAGDMVGDPCGFAGHITPTATRRPTDRTATPSPTDADATPTASGTAPSPTTPATPTEPEATRKPSATQADNTATPTPTPTQPEWTSTPRPGGPGRALLPNCNVWRR